MSTMKGLMKFVADIRACKTKEAEKRRVHKEMAHIRQKFKGGKIDGYQKKKYVAKLMYIFMLGYPVDFGHMEAVSLLSSKKYSEKSIGYTACGVLMNEKHEMIPLLINCILNDLVGKNGPPNEMHQGLALSMIANMGGEDMAEALGAHVQKLVISSHIKPLVRKKASLALLRLFRRNPSIVQPEEWGNTILSALDSRVHGVLLSVLPLLRALIQYSGYEGYLAAVPKLINILHGIVIKREFSSDTLFYTIPSPWLQIKIMSVLRMFPAPKKEVDRENLVKTTMTILSTKANGKSVNYRNAYHSVLFEAINLGLHLELSEEQMKNSVDILGQFIAASETNIRYLGLEAMANFASTRNDSLTKYMPTVLKYIHDPDISIRKRCLDLLYYLTDKKNYETVVAELLSYLVEADLSLREEIVLKVAVLAEKFADSYVYYIDVILSMMALAGEHMSEPIWYRLVQIVINNDEELQKYACKTLLGALQSHHVHEMLVKIGCYVIGEFGHLVGSDPRYSAEEQFLCLSGKYFNMSGETQMMMLTAYLKMVHSYPKLKEPVMEILKGEASSTNVEIQQRAYEYIHVLGDSRLTAKLCEMMPEFSERGSVVEKRLKEKKSAMENEGDMVQEDAMKEGSEEADDEKMADEIVLSQAPRGKSGKSAEEDLLGAAPVQKEDGDILKLEVPEEARGAGAGSGAASTGSLIDDLAEIDLTDGASNSPSASSNTGFGEDNLLEGGGPAPGAVEAADLTGLTTSPPKSNPSSFSQDFEDVGEPEGEERVQNYSVNELKLLTEAKEGVLYEDSTLQIGIKSLYRGNEARFVIYYGNTSFEQLRQFIIEVEQVEGISMMSKPPGTMVESRVQAQHLVAVRYEHGFIHPPFIKIKYITGNSPRHVMTILPIVPTKFIEPLVMVRTTFFGYWKMYGTEQELQHIFQFTEKMDVKGMKSLFSNSLHMALLNGIDANPLNVVCAGQLAVEKSKVVILCRMEVNSKAMMMRLTIRTEIPDDILRESIKELLSQFIK